MGSPVSSGSMNMAFSGVLLLCFMTIHLFQFRFGDTRPYQLCAPPWFINFGGILSLNLFWVPHCQKQEIVNVRDIYRLEFEVFQQGKMVAFYVCDVVIFTIHMCLGWKKAIPATHLEIPMRYHNKATHIGYVMTGFISFIYICYPAYCYMTLEDFRTTLGSTNGAEGPL